MLSRWRRQRRTAPVEGVWSLPLEFNFTRDVVEPLARDPNRRALTYVDASGIVTRHTFADLARGAAQWAGLLRAHRIQPGSVVLVATGATPGSPAIVLGALKAGLVVSPLAVDVDAAELTRRVTMTRAALLVADPAAAQAIGEMQASLERPLAVLYLDETPELLRDQPFRAPTHPTTPHDAALILPTAGTTGDARLVRHTNGHVWSQRIIAEHWLGASSEDLVWCTADTGTAAALSYGLLGPWSRGAEVVLHQGGFDADERLNLIEQLHVTVLCQTPEEYRLLSVLPGIEGCDLRALREAVSFGERPDPKAASRWLGAFGAVLRNGYAQVETGLVLGQRPGEVGAGTGTALPGHDLAVVAGDEELPAGEEGELVVRSRPPSLLAGYMEDEKLERDPYRTGDRAVRDESGVIWITGREADAIVGPGFTIGALEVEAALLAHAAVADAAAVRADASERRGPKAFVMPTARAEPGEDLAEALREHARHAAGVRAVPVEIEFVDALPRTPERKLDRAELRGRAQARPAQPVEASWPEPARLVVPPPRTLESEPQLPTPEPEPEPEVEPERAREPEPVELHAVPEPNGEPKTEPDAELPPEAEPQAEPKPQPISAPSQGSGLAARLAAYGHRPPTDDDSS